MTKCKHFASMFVPKSLWKFFASGLLKKKKIFASGQNPFKSGLQVKKTLCKWLASGLQVVHKPFTSGFLASKPMQILSKLVFVLARFTI